MTIKTGDQVPSVTLHQMIGGTNAAITSEHIFSDKKVVLFALPGAFTPTCSAQHLPGFVELADQFFARGVDSIVCLSVNDAFVMDAWGQHQNVGTKVTMLADGSGLFTRAAGLEIDRVANGMGMRSQRYAMVVDNGRVELINVEADGEFKVSKADVILEAL